MDKPAAAGKASAAGSAAPPASTSTCPASSPQEAKTRTHVPVPVESSDSSQKPHNPDSKTAHTSSSATSASTPSTDAETSGKDPNSGDKAGAAMDRALRAQEEARRLQFALAQQQVQQYQALTKQLEAQSSTTGLAKTSEDLQKLRTEQLARLQQNVQRQAAMAAQAVQKRSNEEWLRNKLVLEQEHLRLLRLHEQQIKQAGKGNSVTTATATSIADSLLAQQQQVLRQQQMLRDMLQKQQKQQHAQRQLQLQLQTGDNNAAATKSSAATAQAVYALKKRKTAFDMELEALARVCIRVANARTDCEMRQALDKMTTWLHRCTELQLLQLAQRDYRDCLAHRRPMMVQQNRWPLDLQVKSEYITQKIVQMLSAFMQREKNKAAQQKAAADAAKTAAAPASSTATAPAAGTAESKPSTTPTASVAPATATNADASASTTVSSAGSSSSAAAAAPTAATTALTAPAATVTTPTTTIMAPAVRIPVKRDMAVVEREYAELKAQLQAKQVETNQKAKAKRDAAKLDAAKTAGVMSNDATTAAMLAATYKRPLQVEIPGSGKKPRTDSYAIQYSAPTAYRPSTTTVPAISPRVAQQFYDLDLSTRTSTDTEDKMYLPPKIVSKIMYKALPGTHEEEPVSTVSSGVTVKQEGQSKSKSHTAPTSSSAGHAQQGQMDDSSQEPVSISDDAVTFMQECVTEFLLYFTSEARDRSIMQNRRTNKGVGLSISGSNVVESMENLGFTSYARVLAGYNEKVKASQDAAALKKMERKRLVKQQAMQRAAAAAAATIAANAAKAAAAGKSAVSSQLYLHPELKPPPPQYGAGRRPSSAVDSTISRVVPAVSPARPATVAASPAGRPALATTPSPKPVAAAAVTVATPAVATATASTAKGSMAGAPPTK
ncbi:hypothetical protein PRIC2_011605 [Phytophthora ramorum]